ncbi:MAG: amidase family protein, partial [Burkholderiales bacterium]
FRGVRVAWSADLGGLPMDPRVTAALAPQRKLLASLGCRVEDAAPDFAGATEAFEVLRALSFLQRVGPLLKTHRALLKDTVIWNIEQGLALGPERIARAQALRTQLFQRMRGFLERYEFLVAPVNQLAPFAVELDYPREIAGVKMGNYLDWMKSCYYITITSHPAISVPAAFTPDGLPVGLQIIGRYRDDLGVLQLAHAFEQETLVGQRRPPLAA